MKRELDVYHSVLSLELGSQPLYLHYGLMSENNSIFQNQQLSTDLVIEHLIEGQNLLEVGGGIGHTAKQLSNLGYTVTSIDKRAYPNSSGVIISDFSTMTLNSEYYDIILFQESAQYFEDDYLNSVILKKKKYFGYDSNKQNIDSKKQKKNCLDYINLEINQ